MSAALSLVRESAPVYRMTRHDFRTVRRAARHDESLSLPAYRFLEDVCDLAEDEGYCYAKQSHFFVVPRLDSEG